MGDENRRLIGTLSLTDDGLVNTTQQMGMLDAHIAGSPSNVADIPIIVYTVRSNTMTRLLRDQVASVEEEDSAKTTLG
jgi:hypothetical protein